MYFWKVRCRQEGYPLAFRPVSDNLPTHSRTVCMRLNDFYAARSTSMPPLTWTNFAPPISVADRWRLASDACLSVVLRAMSRIRKVVFHGDLNQSRDLTLRRTARRAIPFLRSGSTSRCRTGGGSWWRVRRRWRRFWGWSRAL